MPTQSVFGRRRESPRHEQLALFDDAALRGRICDAIEQSVPVLSLLGAQLSHVVDTTEKAALEMLEQMQGMDRAAADVVADAGRLAGVAADHVHEVAEVSRATTAVIERLVDFIERRDRAVLALVEEVRGLSTHVSTIQNISRATTTLALNAKIEASRAGEHGAGFQVVADEVRDLSRQSDVAARDIGHQIETLARRLATAMSDHVGDSHGPTGETPHAANGPTLAAGTDLTDRLHAVAEEQESLAERLNDFAARVEAQSRGLVEASSVVHHLSSSLMAGVQFQDVTRQVIEHVVTSMDDLGAQFNAVSAVLSGREDLDLETELGNALERIRAGYVMKQQRITHAQEVGADWRDPEEPLIELF